LVTVQQENEQMLSLSKRLNSLMEERGVDAAAVARGTGLTPTAISYYRNAKRIPGAQELHRLAMFFGVSMEYFIAETVPPGERPLEKIMDEPLTRLSENEQYRAMKAVGMTPRHAQKMVQFLDAMEQVNSERASDAIKVSRKAEAAGQGQPQEPARSLEAGEPNVHKGSPSPGASPASRGKPPPPKRAPK
jgi:transcriptional regulator with XRE-family HTH domain